MTPTPRIPDRDRPLKTDGELHRALQFLLQAADQRQVWLVMLGEDNRLAGPLIPMSDHPIDPEELVDSDDLGRVSFAHALLARSSTICAMANGRELVYVWERPGSHELTGGDIAWARAAAREARGDGTAKIRAQFVLHDGGLRQLRPDDLI